MLGNRLLGCRKSDNPYKALQSQGRQIRQNPIRESIYAKREAIYNRFMFLGNSC